MSRLVNIIVVLAVLASREPLSAAPPEVTQVPPPVVPVVSPRVSEQVVHDIRLTQGHSFRGQLPADLLATTEKKAGIRVRFFHKNQQIAETSTNDQGQFALHYLPTGTGMLMVGHEKTARVCFCRLWSPGTAPPSAPPSATVRGQNLHVFPTMSFKEVATVTGVVGGAIAVPVIWHNVQQDHKAPVSGS